jgi:hypothetical protein
MAGELISINFGASWARGPLRFGFPHFLTHLHARICNQVARTTLQRFFQV